MVNEGIKQHHISSARLPRSLNVQKFAESRAPELESLHSIISNRLSNDFRSQRNKRRRTTGHDNRPAKKNKRRKKGKFGKVDKGEGLDVENEKKKVSRKVSRRIELRKNLESGFSTSGDGTKRLRTHLWYAKRFVMTKRWGFYLPLGLQGRGRGSRALLKWFKHGALAHDASYCCAVQMEGPEDSLLSILKMVLVPTPSSQFEKLCASEVSGVTYGSAMLHHVGAHLSQLIAPVTYMWRPFIRPSLDISAGDYQNSLHSSYRQMWVWIHAGALTEGLDALRFACEKQKDDTGISVNCFSLEGHLAKLEVTGMKAIQILQKILHPVSGTPESSFQLRKCVASEGSTDPQLQKPFIFEHAIHLPSRAVLSLIVKDPRDLPKRGHENLYDAASSSMDGDVPDSEANDHASLTECSNKGKEVISSLWSLSEANSVVLSDSEDLWDIRNSAKPPVEEKHLCVEKHQKRMTYFHLDDKRSGMPSTEAGGLSSRSCPVLLLKNDTQKNSFVGWSIILPLSWVKAFWVPLVGHGAHAIGLREKHWIASDIGLPFFPSDFPDCKTYSCFMAAEAAVADNEAELRPPAVRPSRVPIPPPWDSVRFAFGVGPPSVGDIQALQDRVSGSGMDNDNFLGDASPGKCDSESLEQDKSPFEGFVARTSSILVSYLNDIHGSHLLLFPNALSGNKPKLLKDRDVVVLDPEGVSQIPLDRKLCFTRVLLRAYKEGSFEEGAVVCAPRLTDIALWTSRLYEQEGLQIPQACISSYFTQQASDKWKLQIPEDPKAIESFRWPIGFVTSGFVRGSTKPTAVAFCEATVLAQLRREQWEGMQTKQRKREIFVLVRNLRSAAYRLALATIVLEQQEEDVEFM